VNQQRQQPPLRQHEQELMQSPSLQQQHASKLIGAQQPIISQTQQQHLQQLQHNQALLAVNSMNLPPHQQRELLMLQLQLNHLQQLTLKQQLAAQELKQEPQSPAAVKINSTRSVFRLPSNNIFHMFSWFCF
jgi:hypothetical protein